MALIDVISRKIFISSVNLDENSPKTIESPELSKELKEKFRIIAEPIGSLCHIPQQQSIKGPPFSLDGHSIGFLIKHCSKDLSFEGEDSFMMDLLSQDSFLVFEDLKKKGYYTISAKKFGADFLVYDKDPAKNHAKFLVFIKDDQLSSDNSLIFLNRLATIAKKEALLAKVSSKLD